MIIFINTTNMLFQPFQTWCKITFKGRKYPNNNVVILKKWISDT